MSWMYALLILNPLVLLILGWIIGSLFELKRLKKIEKQNNSKNKNQLFERLLDEREQMLGIRHIVPYISEEHFNKVSQLSLELFKKSKK